MLGSLGLSFFTSAERFLILIAGNVVQFSESNLIPLVCLDNNMKRLTLGLGNVCELFLSYAGNTTADSQFIRKRSMFNWMDAELSCLCSDVSIASHLLLVQQGSPKRTMLQLPKRKDFACNDTIVASRPQTPMSKLL